MKLIKEGTTSIYNNKVRFYRGIDYKEYKKIKTNFNGMIYSFIDNYNEEEKIWNRNRSIDYILYNEKKINLKDESLLLYEIKNRAEMLAVINNLLLDINI